MTAVLVTRPAGLRDALVSELESRGYDVIAVPTVLTRRIAVDWPDLAQFDWVVVTSVTGAATLPAIPTGPRWAAVGESTARALRARGAQVDIVPAVANGVALADALPDPRGKKVVLVRASLADPDLPSILRDRGAVVEEITAYETVEGPPESAEALQDALRKIAGVVFASGSAVRGFVKLGGRTDLPAITIGPKTSAVARAAGFAVIQESEGRDVPQMAAAVERVIPIEVKRDA
jgi:uroporphyrinogen III methyltransferase/synthase